MLGIVTNIVQQLICLPQTRAEDERQQLEAEAAEQEAEWARTRAEDAAAMVEAEQTNAAASLTSSMTLREKIRQHISYYNISVISMTLREKIRQHIINYNTLVIGDCQCDGWAIKPGCGAHMTTLPPPTCMSCWMWPRRRRCRPAMPHRSAGAASPSTSANYLACPSARRRGRWASPCRHSGRTVGGMEWHDGRHHAARAATRFFPKRQAVLAASRR